MIDVQSTPVRSTVLTHHPCANERGVFPVDTHFWSTLLDEVALGLIVCDRRGVVCIGNNAAHQQLAASRLLRQTGQHLVCKVTNGQSLERTLQQVAAKGRRQLLNLSDGEERLLVSLIPLAQRPGSEPLVLMVLGRHGACSQLGIEMMSSLYGLTGAERRVLKGLIDDVAPRDIADDAGVALSTVRTQIASIRAKLGVSSVQGLLIRAAEVPPFQSALRGLPQWRHPEARH